MKALVLKEYNLFSYEDVPEPQIGPEDLLVKVKSCAICGSDVHGMDGSTGRRIPPIVMGHEAAGIITGVGSNVKGFKAGDRITFDSTVYCGNCYYCRYGRVNLCDNRRVLGVSCGEYRQNGAFAEYVAIPHYIAYSLPESVSYDHAAMVEPVSIALHAVRNSAVAVNTRAVVVGAGMIGLFIIQILKLAGCSRIIAIDLDPAKLNMALQFGATDGLIASETDLGSRVTALTAGRGADVAYEAVGLSQTVITAVDCLRKGGALVLVGNLQPQVDLPLQKVVTREISIKGSCASAGEYPDCLSLIANHRVDVAPLISATAPLADGAAWFQRLYAKEQGLMKVILNP